MLDLLPGRGDVKGLRHQATMQIVPMWTQPAAQLWHPLLLQMVLPVEMMMLVLAVREVPMLLYHHVLLMLLVCDLDHQAHVGCFWTLRITIRPSSSTCVSG